MLGALHPEVRVTGLGVPRARYAVAPLARVIRRERPDAVISQLRAANMAALLAAAWARTAARRVAVQGISFSRGPDRRSSHIAWGRRATTALAYRLADVVVSPSVGVRDDLALWLGLPADKLAVAANPVDIAGIETAAAAPVPHPWLDGAGPPVIVGAGRLVAQKNFALLIDAFARLRARRAARLVILGEGPLRGALEARVRALGLAADVVLPGFVDNPFAWFARAGAFVLSSDYEAFGLVVAEALACGCPVVSTDCAWGPAEILAGGRYGRLVPMADPDALAAAIAELLDSPPTGDLAARAGEYRADKRFQGFMTAAGIL